MIFETFERTTECGLICHTADTVVDEATEES